MALALTARFSGTSAEGHGTGSYTTGSFTPSANSLLVVACYANTAATGNNVVGTLTITDSAGLSWTSGVSVGDSTTTGVTSYGMRIWTAPVGGSPASMTVTLDCGAIDVFCYSVSIFDLTGYDTGAPTGATASGFQAPAAAANAWTITLSGAPATTSIVVAAVGVDLNSGSGMAVTVGTGWTEIHDVTSSVPNENLQTQYRGSSTSTSVTWDDTDAGAGPETTFARISTALEVKESTGPPPPAPNLLVVRSNLTLA